MRFQSNVVVASVLCLALAVALDVLLLTLGRMLSPWTKRAAEA